LALPAPIGDGAHRGDQDHLSGYHRHLHVEYDDVGHLLAGEVHGLLPVRGLRDHLLEVAAEGKTTEVAVAAERYGAGHHALRPDQSNGRFRYDSLLLGSSFPTGYAPDPSALDVLLLVRPDGTTAAVFSARGVTAEGVLEAAGPDRGLRTHEEPLSEP